MDPRYFADAHFLQSQYSSTGLTPYLNGTMADQNVFETEYAAHEQWQQQQKQYNDFASPLQSLDLPENRTNMSPVSYDPQLLGKPRENSSSGSSSDQSPMFSHASRPTQEKRSSSEMTSLPSDQEDSGNSTKRNKFLERNRLAAAKCRTKKKEWTNNLEAAARQASQQTRELHAIVQNLRNEVMEYKTQLMNHQGCDCHAVQDYLLHESSNPPELNN